MNERSTMRALKCALLAGMMIVLASCAAVKPRNDDPGFVLGNEALQRSREGDYARAAKLYEQAGDVSLVPPYYYLRAADAQLRVGDTTAARRLLRVVDPDRLDTVDGSFLVLLSARVDLNEGNARQAMRKLDGLNYNHLEPRQQLHYHSLRASAYNQMGDLLNAVRERIARGHFLTVPADTQENDTAIYELVSRLPEDQLSNRGYPPPDELGGWLELAHVMREAASVRQSQITRWRALYPVHPANGRFLDGLQSSSPVPDAAAPEQQVKAPVPSVLQMLVLLPSSGSYAPAAEAIRLGMEQARQASDKKGDVNLVFMDSQTATPEQLYRKAHEAGAGVVVGPLLKDQVAAMTRINPLDIPVLALNQATGADADNLYQMSLTPEQEIEQLADRAWADGSRSVLILAPETAFGKRTMEHFAAYWRRLGGQLAVQKTYAAGSGNFSAVATDIANIISGAGASSATPYEQGLPDFIWMVADAHDARIIKPSLDAMQVRLPVYAHSSLFMGRADAILDQPLDGVVFCDIPWVIRPGEGGALSQTAMQAGLTRVQPDYLRLVAFGLDAFQLGTRIQDMKHGGGFSFSGFTGTLRLPGGHVLQREASCAEFANGRPVPR